MFDSFFVSVECSWMISRIAGHAVFGQEELMHELVHLQQAFPGQPQPIPLDLQDALRLEQR
jgi:hypothetical protein